MEDLLAQGPDAVAPEPWAAWLQGAPPGFHAVLARAARDLGLEAAAQGFAARTQADGADHDYYSRVLALLADLEFP